MKNRFINALLLINVLSLLLIIIITVFPSSVIRIVLGLPFLLFFPGYTLVMALFPRADQLEGVERIALSFGLSMAIVPLTGFLMNLTPWGIELYATLVSLTILIVVFSTVTWYRQRKLSETERFTVSFRWDTSWWRRLSLSSRWLSIVLVVALLGTVATFGYVSTTPTTREQYTEFYLLGPGGEAIDYPQELKVGEEASVTVVVVNREHETTSYRVEVIVDGTPNNSTKPFPLEHEEKWQEAVSFSPERLGDPEKAYVEKVEFLLYKDLETEPCLLPLHLWVIVNGEGG